MKLNTKSQLGFTLIELLVVISIMQLFASLILVAANKAKIRGDYAKAQQDLSSIRAGIELLVQDTGKWPFGCAVDQVSDTEIWLSLPESGLYTRPTPQVIASDSNPGQAKYLYDYGIHDSPPPTGYTPTAYTTNPNYPITGNCAWTPEDVSLWNGPYVKADNLTDPWKFPYVFDRDYNDPWDSTKVYVAIMSWGPPRLGNSKKQVAIPLANFSLNPIQFP
jgi:prepilin-type N-terminal cleavage/methylation domain-containing protein